MFSCGNLTFVLLIVPLKACFWLQVPHCAIFCVKGIYCSQRFINSITRGQIVAFFLFAVLYLTHSSDSTCIVNSRYTPAYRFTVGWSHCFMSNKRLTEVTIAISNERFHVTPLWCRQCKVYIYSINSEIHCCNTNIVISSCCADSCNG